MCTLKIPCVQMCPGTVNMRDSEARLSTLHYVVSLQLIITPWKSREETCDAFRSLGVSMIKGNGVFNFMDVKSSSLSKMHTVYHRIVTSKMHESWFYSLRTEYRIEYIPSVALPFQSRHVEIRVK